MSKSWIVIAVILFIGYVAGVKFPGPAAKVGL